MRRISIVSLMWYVGFIALGLAALRNANHVWMGATLLLTLGTLGAAVVGVVNHRGKTRAWWFGFAVFGCGYMAVAFGPWFTRISQRLGTTQFFVYVHQQVQPSAAEHYSGSLAELEKSYTSIEATLDRIAPVGSVPDSHAAGMISSRNELRAVLIERGSSLTKGLELTEAQQTRRRLKQILPAASDYEAFESIGHCLFALLAALVGAVISSRMYRAHLTATGQQNTN